jgi:hypothetical protein
MRNGLLLSVVCLMLAQGLARTQGPLLPQTPQPIGINPQAPLLPAPSPSDSPGTLVPPYPPPGLALPPEAVVAADQGCSSCLWLGVESLGWWVKNQPLSVPVLTTGPASQGDVAGNLGALGSTAIRSPLDYGLAAGLRLSGGYWFDAAHTYAIEGSVFFLERRSASFAAFDPSGTGNVVINEPLAGATFITQVSAPGRYSGGASVDTSNTFWGAELNARYSLSQGDGWAVGLLGGFRYLEVNEALTISSTTTFLVPGTYTDGAGKTLVTAPPGSLSSVVDFFGTRNQFYGGQVGACFEGHVDRWFLGAVGKLALGTTREEITATGYTLVSPVNAAPVPLWGGNYVGGTNAGRYWGYRFAVAPEVQVNVGCQLGSHVRAMLGYNFLYLSSVARPGNQIDNVYDGVNRPAVPMASSSFWAQGLTFTLLINY